MRVKPPEFDRPEPRVWTLEERHAYALTRIEKTMVKYPAIAETWLKEANQLEARIKSQK